ncbi:MAG: M15 family metallopeptidase [Defluviitaleaceae bacterium]|nr:M15 family metallopeptidase [Defluviitaleaceae bacterium]
MRRQIKLFNRLTVSLILSLFAIFYMGISKPAFAKREPVVFCGHQADPAQATILTDEQALSYLALVNRCYRVSNEFKPADLSVVNVKSINMHWGPHLLRETAARAAEDLFQAAEKDGMVLIATSAYRTHEHQTIFYENNVARLGVEEARRVSAVPGHSEHQLGLALDVSTDALEGNLVEAFAQTPEGKWIREQAHHFGFMISYPQHREVDTGFIYEPWHLRFVGVAVATELFETGQVLEEFLWHEDSETGLIWYG